MQDDGKDKGDERFKESENNDPVSGRKAKRIVSCGDYSVTTEPGNDDGTKESSFFLFCRCMTVFRDMEITGDKTFDSS